jgi:glycosyltransferase involved in cell wall biosynthesis
MSASTAAIAEPNFPNPTTAILMMRQLPYLPNGGELEDPNGQYTVSLRSPAIIINSMRHSDTPLVSIVTPSYNMGSFLAKTIESVLSQDYPRIEYIVVDGGSTDGSLEILKRYQGRLRYEYGPDQGQGDAINKGFLQSHGQIFAFLNADDTYLPGAVSTAVRHMLANPGYAGVYGEAYLVDEHGTILRPYPTRDFDPELLIKECFICQPAVFLWREAFIEAGMIDPTLRNGMDYDLWFRIAKKARLLRIGDYLATSRMHQGAKTLRERLSVYSNAICVVRRHCRYVPFCHIYAYCCSLLDKRDGFFEPVPPSLAKFLLAVLYGSGINFRHLWRFWAEALRDGCNAIKRGAWPARA